LVAKSRWQICGSQDINRQPDLCFYCILDPNHVKKGGPSRRIDQQVQVTSIPISAMND